MSNWPVVDRLSFKYMVGHLAAIQYHNLNAVSHATHQPYGLIINNVYKVKDQII